MRLSSFVPVFFISPSPTRTSIKMIFPEVVRPSFQRFTHRLITGRATWQGGHHDAPNSTTKMLLRSPEKSIFSPTSSRAATSGAIVPNCAGWLRSGERSRRRNSTTCVTAPKSRINIDSTTAQYRLDTRPSLRDVSGFRSAPATEDWVTTDTRRLCKRTSSTNRGPCTRPPARRTKPRNPPTSGKMICRHDLCSPHREGRSLFPARIVGWKPLRRSSQGRTWVRKAVDLAIGRPRDPLPSTAWFVGRYILR